MNPRRRVLCWAMGLLPVPALAGMSPVEEVRIERLIEYVRSRHDVTFVRNGSDYSCEDAANFMRGKLRAMGAQVSTAQQFIEQIATKSSTTGKPYTARLADGKTMPLAQFLGDELKRMDGKH